MAELKFDISDIKAIYTSDVIRGDNHVVAEAYIRDMVMPRVQSNMEWAKDFIVESDYTPLPDIQGYATYQATGFKRRPSVMLDAHVPRTEVSQEDTAGYNGRYGSIPQFARGLYDDAESLDMYESIAKTQGAQVAMEQFANNTARLLNGLYAVATRLGHQKLTTGKCMANWGNGVAWELTSTIDPSHFLKAGAKVWTDTEGADIPTYVYEHYQAIRAEQGDPEWKGKMLIWEQFALEVMLKNKFVIAEVNKYKDMIGNRNVTYISTADGGEMIPVNSGGISLQDLQDYSNSPYSKFPRIEYRNGSQFTSTIAEGYNNFAATTGWKDGAVVIMPDVPYAGVIKKAKVRDIEDLIKNKAVDVTATWTSVAGGMGWMLNVMGKNGLLQKYDTKLFASFIPELTEWDEHYVIDTKTAN